MEPAMGIGTTCKVGSEVVKMFRCDGVKRVRSDEDGVAMTGRGSALEILSLSKTACRTL